jgi:Protein of unknown function (DUF1822)
MNYQEISNNSLPFLLGFTAHEFAQEVVSVYPIKNQEYQQNYRNALAVYAVNRYFTCIQLTTDLEKSCSSRLSKDSNADFADLYLPGIGILECRLIDAKATSVHIPDSAIGERIGCVVLRIVGDLEDLEDVTEVEIIGFTPDLSSVINIADLKSTEDLLDRLEKLEIAASSKVKQVEKVVAMIPNLQVDEFMSWIKEEFNPENIYSFVNRLEQRINQFMGINHLEIVRGSLRGSGNQSSEPDELRDLLFEILDAKLEEQGISIDDEE